MSEEAVRAGATPAARRRALRKLLAARAAGDARVLSAQQERLWVAHHLDPSDPSQNLRSAIHVTGPLDIDLLETCFAELVRAHEQLRATFGEERGTPVAKLSEPRPLAIRRIDLTGAAGSRPDGEPDASAACERSVREQAAEPFDLEQGPPLRVALLTLGEREFVIVLTVHHIVCDAWSMSLLLRQLGELYEAASSGREPRLGAPASSYGAFAEAQLTAFANGSDAASEAFWQRQLAGYRADSPLFRSTEASTATPRPSHRLRIDWPSRLGAGVERLAASQGTTAYTVLLAAFGALLGRLSGRTDLVVASPAANRERRELEEVVGYFVNLLPLRLRLPGATPFTELLDGVRRTVLGAHLHQQLPLHRIATAAGLRPAALPGVVYQHVAAPRRRIEAGGLVLEPRPIDLGRSRHLLSLTTFPGADGLRGWLEYGRDLLDEAAARQLVADLERVLEHLVADPAATTEQLPVASDWSRPAARQRDTAGRQGGAGTAAASVVEERLAEIWRALLDLDSVSRLDNFLDVGGDSLLAMQVIERVESELGVRLTPADLFSQTLAQLAATCETRRD